MTTDMVTATALTTEVLDESAGGRAEAERVLAELAAHLEADLTTNIGFPSTLDIDYRRLWPFFNHVLNNVGDPFVESAYPRNTKHLERELLAWFAELMRASHSWWGVTTSGGTEGIEYGLVHARRRYPEAVAVFSQAAHYSVMKSAIKLGLPTVAVRTGHDGMLDLYDLRDVVRAQRHRPIIVVASIGTTMTEAIDDVGTIREILAEQAVSRAWVHSDAALSGLPLALLPPGGRPRYDLADGADSISISGHKFLGSPFPCGVYLTNRGGDGGSTVDYIATNDTTIAGSRSGHAPMVMWYAVKTLGRPGLLARANRAWQVAAYAIEQLRRAGVPAWRHPHAMTVVLPTPPHEIAARWRLPSSGGLSHLITVPGVTTRTIDSFVADLRVLAEHPGPQPAWSAIPALRSPTYGETA